jgi:signal transduction histidine kinase/DNA-binding NarL/FixJ family response regulator
MDKTRVLLIENNQSDIDHMLAYCATHAPHMLFTVVETRSDCWDALASDQTLPFDVLIIDYLLPDTDGMDLLHEIVNAGYPAPIVIITVRQDVETAVAAMKAGALDYLVKSDTYWEHLPRIIESAIVRYNLTRENQRLQGDLTAYAAELQRSIHQTHLEKMRLQAVLEQLPEGVLIVEGTEGRTIAANHAAEHLWGHPFIPDVCMPDYGKHYKMYRLDGSPIPPEEYATSRVLRSGKPVLGEQVLFKQPGGEQINVLVNVAPLLNQHRAVSGAVALFQDITEIKQLEQLKDDVLSIASHELKNPLTVIKGYSSLLIKSPLIQEDARMKRITSTILHQSERMHQLVERLLDLSRLDMGRMTLNEGPIDLVPFLQSIREQQQATHAACTLRCHCEQPSLVVTGDYMRLEQVMINLISNAIKYSTEDAEITITLSVQEEIEQANMVYGSPLTTPGPYVVIAVQDRGIGIEPAMQQKLFNRFYRAREAARIAAGQGMGLYISAEIMRLHQGVLCVQSTPGAGSTFHVILPLERDESDSYA